MSFNFDEKAGEIRDGNIRYLLMRPDVLMGLVKYLNGNAKVEALKAFQKSAFENGKASLVHYRKFDFTDSDELLAFICQTASKLGWGNWAHTLDKNGIPVFTVNNSPFAAGYGQSDQPVCAPIGGILRALMEVYFAKDMVIKESSCVAQGATSCRFEMHLSPQSS